MGFFTFLPICSYPWNSLNSPAKMAQTYSINRTYGYYWTYRYINGDKKKISGSSTIPITFRNKWYFSYIN